MFYSIIKVISTVTLLVLLYAVCRSNLQVQSCASHMQQLYKTTLGCDSFHYTTLEYVLINNLELIAVDTLILTISCQASMLPDTMYSLAKLSKIAIAVVQVFLLVIVVDT